MLVERMEYEGGNLVIGRVHHQHAPPAIILCSTVYACMHDAWIIETGRTGDACTAAVRAAVARPRR